MDEFSKKKIIDLESKLKSKTIECDLLQTNILILTQQMEATDSSLKLLTQSLTALEQQFRSMDETGKPRHVKAKSDFLA